MSGVLVVKWPTRGCHAFETQISANFSCRNLQVKFCGCLSCCKPGQLQSCHVPHSVPAVLSHVFHCHSWAQPVHLTFGELNQLRNNHSLYFWVSFWLNHCVIAWAPLITQTRRWESEAVMGKETVGTAAALILATFWQTVWSSWNGLRCCHPVNWDTMAQQIPLFTVGPCSSHRATNRHKTVHFFL